MSTKETRAALHRRINDLPNIYVTDIHIIAAELAREVEELGSSIAYMDGKVIAALARAEKAEAELATYKKEKEEWSQIHMVTSDRQICKAHAEIAALKARVVVLPIDRYRDGLDGLVEDAKGDMFYLPDILAALKQAGIAVKGT